MTCRCRFLNFLGKLVGFIGYRRRPSEIYISYRIVVSSSRSDSILVHRQPIGIAHIPTDLSDFDTHHCPVISPTPCHHYSFSKVVAYWYRNQEDEGTKPTELVFYSV